VNERRGPTKRCPYCAEEIQSDAVRCRFCGGVVVSEELRAAVERWSPLPITQQNIELDRMTDQQRSTFRAAWEALKSEKSPVTPAQPVVVQKGRSGCAWIFIIADGIIAAIVIMSLL
jgi:hypothetical protein